MAIATESACELLTLRAEGLMNSIEIACVTELLFCGRVTHDAVEKVFAIYADSLMATTNKMFIKASSYAKDGMRNVSWLQHLEVQLTIIQECHLTHYGMLS